MKKLIILVILLLIPSFLFAQEQVARMNPYVAGIITTVACTAADASCTGFLICQNFENTVEPCTVCNEDNSETWTASSVNVDHDYTSTILRGTQSLYIPAGYNDASPTFTNTSEIWFHFLWRASSFSTADYRYIFELWDSGTTLALRISTQITTGYWGVKVGTSTTVYSSVAPSIDTDYRIWGYYKKGTGANAIGTIWVGTDTNRPGSSIATTSTGNATVDVARVSLMSGTLVNAIFDQILVDDAVFTTVCP